MSDFFRLMILATLCLCGGAMHDTAPNIIKKKRNIIKKYLSLSFLHAAWATSMSVTVFVLVLFQLLLMFCFIC